MVERSLSMRQVVRSMLTTSITRSNKATSFFFFFSLFFFFFFVGPRSILN